MRLLDYDCLVSDSSARRAARGAGLIAKKSRWRKGSVDNYGRYMLVEPTSNIVVAGVRFDMTAEEVVDYCWRMRFQRDAQDNRRPKRRTV
jgi:hypothetical protein